MRLNETEMVKLLPAWMQEDGSDKGIATGCDIISRDAYARLKLLSRWDKIDQLSDAELDEMAWELNIQWYDSTAPIAAKRAVIRNSDRVYAKLGTPYAVEQIVADYFGTGEVREWYQYSDAFIKNKPAIPKAVTKTVQTLSDAASKSFTVTGYILSVILIDSVTKEQVIGDVSFENATASANGKVTVTLAAAPSNPILVIITSIAL